MWKKKSDPIQLRIGNVTPVEVLIILQNRIFGFIQLIGRREANVPQIIRQIRLPRSKFVHDNRHICSAPFLDNMHGEDQGYVRGASEFTQVCMICIDTSLRFASDT